MLLQVIKAAFGNRKRDITCHPTNTSSSMRKAPYAPIPKLIAGRRLHIGGHVIHDDWEIFDAQPRTGVDHVGDASDLSRFPDSTFAAVYASHVLEHFEYCRTVAVLREWGRVLRRDGLLFISVPDLDLLSAIFLDKHNSILQQRSDAIRILFGGQIDPWDYHKAAFNEEVLVSFLRQACFSNAQRVTNFGFFSDTSSLVFLQKEISLNIVARKL